MIDWGELIGAENQAENSGITPIRGARIKAENSEITQSSGARPTIFTDNYEEVGRLQSSIHEGFESSTPLAPPAPLKNKGIG